MRKTGEKRLSSRRLLQFHVLHTITVKKLSLLWTRELLWTERFKVLPLGLSPHATREDNLHKIWGMYAYHQGFKLSSITGPPCSYQSKKKHTTETNQGGVIWRSEHVTFADWRCSSVTIRHANFFHKNIFSIKY